MTALEGHEEDEQSWQRGLVPLCARCHRLLRDASEGGLRLKATGQRWFAGHTVGLFNSPGAPSPPPIILSRDRYWKELLPSMDDRRPWVGCWGGSVAIMLALNGVVWTLALRS